MGSKKKKQTPKKPVSAAPAVDAEVFGHGQTELPKRYFSFASAEKCAEQLAFVDIESN